MTAVDYTCNGRWWEPPKPRQYSIILLIMCFWIHLQLDDSKLIDKLLISDDRHHFDQFGHYTAVKETIIEMPWLMVLPSICFKCLIKFISAKEGNTFPIARFSLILEKLGNTFPIACFSLILEKSENTKKLEGHQALSMHWHHLTLFNSVFERRKSFLLFLYMSLERFELLFAPELPLVERRRLRKKISWFRKMNIFSEKKG